MKRAQVIRVKVTNARAKVRAEEKKPEAWFIAGPYLNSLINISSLPWFFQLWEISNIEYRHQDRGRGQHQYQYQNQ